MMAFLKVTIMQWQIKVEYINKFKADTKSYEIKISIKEEIVVMKKRKLRLTWGKWWVN